MLKIGFVLEKSIIRHKAIGRILVASRNLKSIWFSYCYFNITPFTLPSSIKFKTEYFEVLGHFPGIFNREEEEESKQNLLEIIKG